MSNKPVKTNALAWSGSSRRVAEGKANQGAVEGFSLGVAETRTATAAEATRPRGKSAFTERPCVDVQQMADDEPRPARSNGRVKLDRY
ncbi:MAG: hypothetical protein KC912_07085 [Proteobacteria bacterium]|nr:hypothetical protein [Pseudomonadota bacterium]